MENTAGALLVSWSFSGPEDTHILLVGRKTPKEDVDVINAFQGQDAHDIYEILTTRTKGD